MNVIASTRCLIATEIEKEIESENAVRDATLVDNTAQSIHRYLKEIENKREVYEKRWIWELLQNALDSAWPDKQIKVEIIRTDDALVFVHDGRPFKREEISHLIYHGSTKTEEDIGKFGTGFLVTHLLSRIVNVKGKRIDGKTFEFNLNRNGGLSEDIKTLMEKTWKEYLDSLKTPDNYPGYTARMEYPLSALSSKTVDVGLEELAKIAPYVLAFNDNIGTITIENKHLTVKFELVEVEKESCCTYKTVKEEENGNTKNLHELCIARNEEVEVAIKGRESDNGKSIDKLEDIPKIFLAFPLFATQDLPFPIVVNSRKFVPGERRDGVFLGKKETDDIKLNKRLLEDASKLFIELVSKIDCSRWNNIQDLFGLGVPPEKEWLDRDWYTALLKNLIIGTMPLKVLKTENGCLMTLKDGYIPATDSDEENIESLWDIFHGFSLYRDKIPAKALAREWAKIISGWKSIGADLSLIKVTTQEVSTELARSANLDGLKTKLAEGQDEYGLINDFYKLLLNSKKQWIFDNSNVLPDQNGTFRRKKELSRDEGIDNDLKIISKSLGDDVSNHLLDSKVYVGIQSLLSGKKQEEILDQALVKVKQISISNGSADPQPNIDLFDWLLRNAEFENLAEYPMLTMKEKTFSSLSKEKEKLLAPKELWDKRASQYYELFPQDSIISSLYYTKNAKQELWKELVNNGLILIDPLYLGSEKIRQDDLEHFLLSGEKIDEEKVHEIAGEIELSRIAFLETTDKGIMSTTRDSKLKTRKFLNFVFDYIIEADRGHWNNVAEVTCECGSKHKIHPAQWVSVLKSRKWVPAPKDKPLTSANLAVVLEGQDEILRKCRQELPFKLLNILKISVSEVMMDIAAKNDATKLELDKAMGSLFNTFMTRPDKLNKIAQLAESDTDLFVTEIEKRIHDRDQINRNQQLGAKVEELLQKVLRDQNFIVERTGVGSDFEIENDYISDNQENLLAAKKENNTKILIEIKSTYRNFVRMTITQAKEARDKADKYVLCVVTLYGGEISEDSVKAGVKFITDIGQKIADKVVEVENHEHEQEAIAVGGDIEIELNEGPIKFRINDTVWEQGKNLEQFVEFTKTL